MTAPEAAWVNKKAPGNGSGTSNSIGRDAKAELLSHPALITNYFSYG
jgi:hypothetical protein